MSADLIEARDQLHEATQGLRGLCVLLGNTDASPKPELLYHLLRPLVDIVAKVDGTLQGINHG